LEVKGVPVSHRNSTQKQNEDERELLSQPDRGKQDLVTCQAWYWVLFVIITAPIIAFELLFLLPTLPLTTALLVLFVVLFLYIAVIGALIYYFKR
jgi:hypothetical protein